MRILLVILLLVLTYIAVDSLSLHSSKVPVQKATEITSDDFGEEDRQLAYNKSALLVRKKRVALIATVLTAIGTAYICTVLVNATPIDATLKRWAMKFWGFREGKEATRWKALAKFVHRNVPLDADNNLDESKKILNFIDAPAGLESQVERFRMEATLTMTKIMEDEAEEEARLKQEHQENQKRGINASGLLNKVKNWRDLDQMTKAMMADNIIYTLISINGMGETTWKVNPNKQEHRDIYDALLKIKAAIDRKYKEQCQLRTYTAKELPELKAWYVRLLGAVPQWLQNVFSGVKAAEHEKVKMDQELIKRINDIHAMAEEVLKRAEEAAKKAREKNRDKTKLAAELIEPIKCLEDAVKILPPKEKLLKEKESGDRAKVGQTKSKHGTGLFPTPAQLSNATNIDQVANDRKRKEEDTEQNNVTYLPVEDIFDL